jgi:hypothetical protein
VIQARLQKFLGSLKKNSKGLVTTTQVKGGYLLAKDIRLGPKCLVPAEHQWSGLVALILPKFRSWESKPPLSPETMGAFYDKFGFKFAAEQGVFDLADIPGEGDNPMHG